MSRILLTLLLVLLAAACGAEGNPPGECPVLPTVHAAPAFEPRSHTAGGEAGDSLSASWPEYLLTADSGSAMPGAGIAYLCGVHLLVHDLLGRIVEHVTAATAELDRQRERLVARGSVVVDLPLQRRSLETEELHYAPRENRVWSPVTTTFHEHETVLTDRDLVVRCLAERHFRDCPVADHMTMAHLDTVAPDAAVEEVMNLMERDQVRRILVTAQGRLVGIIAQADLALKEGPAEPLKVEEVLERTPPPRSPCGKGQP
jgi:CBS domain-containing protein